MFFKERKGFFANELKKNMQLASSGYLNYYPLVFCVFSENHTQSKLDAAEFLAIMLQRLSFNEIIKIDIQMRETTPEWSIDWTRLDLVNFLLTEMSKEQKAAVLAFASFHPNGYLREKAVRFLSQYDMTLPYILLRKNDWVQQVRKVGQKSFEIRMENLSEGELLAALPFVEKLNRCNRESHQFDNERFYNALLNPKNNGELEIGAVKLDEKMNQMDTFQTFIKPTKNPILSDFCKNLTSISQDDVDQAPYFAEAMCNFENWISSNLCDSPILISWGYYDKNQLLSECKVNLLCGKFIV